MSKIICDVCGTSYPDTATQCPICGCVRTAETRNVSDRSRSSKKGNDGYTYVKGGRFSKNNVRKRNSANGVVSVNVVKDKQASSRKAESSANRGLIATVIVLLLAIVAAVLYITIRFFVPGVAPQETTPLAQTVPTDETTLATAPCEKMELDVITILLDKVDATYEITATVSPADTTDSIEFVSADESVAKVSADGNKATVTAVAEGQTMIIVKCGDIKASCTVECAFTSEDETTESTGETAPEGAVLELNRADMTLSRVGETWNLHKGDIPLELITWKSGNTGVATVENGVVKAVGNGMTTIYAEYGEQKASCIVRCSLSSADSNVSGNGGGISEDG